MPTGMDTLRVGSDTTGNTSHIRSIIQFSKHANAAKKSNGMNFKWKYYDEDSHGSVPLITEYDALRYIFGYYRMNYDPAETAETFANHYKAISDKLGYTKLPPENAINDKGYGYLSQKKFDQALSFFDLNIRNYPASPNAHDSMGEYYLAAGDTTKAKESFVKSLGLKEVAGTRKKLQDLED
jgi:tetratricopeptide (TPR) repeat protein